MVLAVSVFAGSSPRVHSGKAKDHTATHQTQQAQAYQKEDQAIPGLLPLTPASKLETAEDRDRNEYNDLRESYGIGRPLSDQQKARYLLLEERFSRISNHGTLDSTGGPDAFGYRFVDNQMGDTATYAWIELRDDPETVWINTWSSSTSHDDVYSASKHPIGFLFPFYSSTLDSFRVSSNGFVQFTTTATALSNGQLPSTSVAGPAIFPYWDDLHLNYGGYSTGTDVVGYKNFGDYTVIEYDSVGHCCTNLAASYKFEVILYQDGRIKIQYNTISQGTYINTQTIGIQSNGAAGSPALNYCYNATGHQPVSEMAIWFYSTGTGSITGTVVDENAAPVPDARVNIWGTSVSTTTNPDGIFSMPIVPVGTYTLMASKHGFLPDTAENVEIVIGHMTTVNFTIENAGILTFSSTDVPQPIQDYTLTTSTITISQPAAIIDLDVGLNITHTYDNDLIIKLISPDGDTVQLCRRHGSTGDNFTNTIFDDEGDTLIASGHAPFTGYYIPDQPLSGFDTQNMMGTWTLAVWDSTTSNSGNLEGWDLYVTPGATSGGMVSGTVTRADNSEPISGITVTIPTDPPLTRITGPTGGYSFGIVAAGTYTMSFAGGSFTTVNHPGVVVTNGSVTTVNSSMYVSIHGTVTAQSTGDPVPGAHVSVDGTSASAITNAEGFYELGGIAAGTYNLTFTAVLFDDATQSGVVVTQSATATANIALSSNFQIYSSTDGPVGITDRDTSYSVISVEDDFPTESVSVLINSITHTFDGDLHIWLRPPTGEDIDLCNRHGSSGNDFTNTLFDDNATTPIAQGTAPFTGSFIPEQPLAPLVGMSSAGDWTLVVYDAAGGDVGNINQWSIVIGGSATPRGTLVGTVRRFTNSQPMPGVLITVTGTNVSTTTFSDGTYSVSVPVGTWSVVYSYEAYCDSIVPGVLINEAQNTFRNVSMRNPNATVSVSSINEEAPQGETFDTPFTISNTGNCPLTYAITDTSSWIDATPATGSINPGQQANITVHLNAAGLAIGEYLSQLSVTHNGADSPWNIAVFFWVGVNAVGDEHSALPEKTALYGNSPNPFNPTTTIRYDLKSDGLARLTVFDLLGHQVAVLVDGRQSAGHYEVPFDGTNLASGMYFYRFESQGVVQTSKMVLMK